MLDFLMHADNRPLAELPDAVLADPASLLRERVIRATRALMVDAGLNVSMDQIAAAAGISRRSLFRHFDSRDALVGAALDSAFRWYSRELDTLLQAPGPLADWLRAVLQRSHQSHLNAGRGMWQLASARDDELPPEFSAANRRRREMRRRMTTQFANRAWLLAGGQGDAPEAVLEAFMLVMSSYATHSMIIDRKRSTESVVRSGCALLMAVLNAATNQRH